MDPHILRSDVGVRYDASAAPVCKSFDLQFSIETIAVSNRSGFVMIYDSSCRRFSRRSYRTRVPVCIIGAIIWVVTVPCYENNMVTAGMVEIVVGMQFHLCSSLCNTDGKSDPESFHIRCISLSSITVDNFVAFVAVW